MNKSLLSGMVVVAVVVFALSSTGVVHAQSDTNTTAVVETGYGMGTRGGRGGGMMVGGLQDGLLHDEMIAVFSEKLGISVDDLNARLAGGETLYSIALSEGLTAEEFTTLMTDTRNQAIDQAVVDGTLTQTQADWMKSRSSMMGSGTQGTRGTGGMRGQFATGTCLTQ